MEDKSIKYDIQQEPIVISKATSDIILNRDPKKGIVQKYPADLMALYWFYYYTAKWQETNQPKATTSYASIALKWSQDRVRRTKKQLIELKLIEDIVTKDKNTNKIIGHYINVKFIWWNKDKINNFHTTENPDCGNTLTVENSEGNTLNTNKSNSLNTNIEKSLLHKDRILKNPIYKTSDSFSSNKPLQKRKPLQRSKNNDKTLSPKLIHTMTKQEKEKFYEYQTKAVCLSERDKIKLKIQQQKEVNLLKHETKPLQDKNNPKNSEKIIYNKNINNSKIKYLMEFWNDLGLMKQRKDSVIKRAVMMLEKHLKDYSVDQIKQSMKQYNKMISNKADYTKIRGQSNPYKVSLPEFFEFSSFTLKRIKENNGDKKTLTGIKSWFIECLNDENYLKEKYSVIAKDKYPEITKEIKKAWNKYLYEWDGRYEEMKEEGQYTAFEENIYRKISRRLVEFFEANKNELKADDALELTQWFESCVTEIENSEYQLGFLAGDIFFNDQFIRYLKEQDAIGDKIYTHKEWGALSKKEKDAVEEEKNDYSYLYSGMNEDVTIHDLIY